MHPLVRLVVRRPLWSSAFVFGATCLPAVALAQEAPVSHHATVLTGCPASTSDGLPGAALSEAAERGITINTSHVEYATTRCADRGTLLGASLGNASSTDALVVVFDGAGVEDASARFRDQLRIASLVPANGLAVLVALEPGADGVEVSDDAVRKLLAEARFDGDRTPIIRGSALRASACDPKAQAAFDALHAAVAKVAPIPPRDKDKPFLVPVEEVEDVAGRRVMSASGRVEGGTIAVGDAVELVGEGRRVEQATVIGVASERQLLDRGEAGDDVTLLLRGIDKKDIRRGMVIAKPGSVKAHREVVAQVYVLRKEEGGRHTPFHNKYRPQLYFRTSDVTGEITLEAGRDVVEPGTDAPMTVDLIVPIAMDKGLRFAIREGGRTVGAGQVIEIVK